MDKEKFWETLKMPPGIRGECGYCVHEDTRIFDHPCTGCYNKSKPNWKWNGWDGEY